MVEPNSRERNGQLENTEWRPARTAICRKGGCPASVADGAEWCDKHLDDVTARRAAVADPPREDNVSSGSSTGPLLRLFALSDHAEQL
jgi:hypothetical protein